MSNKEQARAHAREAVRSLVVMDDSAENHDDPWQVLRYIKDAKDRLGRAEAAAQRWVASHE